MAEEIIAFTWDDVMYQSRADGTERRVITKFPGAPYPYAGPLWSPDGEQLIVRTEAEATKGDGGDLGGVKGFIFRVNADGSNLVSLSAVSGSHYDGTPAWSPDGRHIVYTARKPGDRVGSLYIMARDGTNPRKIADLEFEAQYPSWGGGGRIAFTGANNGGFDLFTIKPDGSDLQRLTRTPEPENWPSYSPDGEQLAFFAARDGVDGIWVMDADGSNPLMVAAGGEPNWSPQGDFIVFDCGDQEKAVVCAVRPDGSDLLTMFEDGAFPAVKP